MVENIIGGLYLVGDVARLVCSFRIATHKNNQRRESEPSKGSPQQGHRAYKDLKRKEVGTCRLTEVS